jgi:peptidoglycan/xylan/chitin deacetylase (PgdA/CDA1 family)/GT2 family glycosyltransferase/2-polyprenyl-3-methyl-5-hydroxy-6-metoxy-1,4-benzoquinol methylase
MMAGLPLISIVIPARNAAATLAETLDSVLAQSIGDWEAIIVDDGSTDETAAITASYAARDPRFSGVTGPGRGVGNARNLGIAAARGKYLHFLDADDWNDPKFYEKLLNALAAHPGATIAYCGYCRIMQGGGVTEPYRMPDMADGPFEDFARGCPVAIHAVLVERELIVRLGGFDTSLGNCEDWDLWQRVARFPRKWVLVDEGLAYYRTDGTSLSRNVEWLLAHSRIILKRGFEGDARLAAFPEARQAPPSEISNGSSAQAHAYNAVWTAGMACGSGDSGKLGEDMLRPFRDARTEAASMARVIYEGLMVGTRSLPGQMAERWPLYGARVTELIRWLGEVWEDPKAGRAIQYHLEEMILYHDGGNPPKRLALTQSVLIDVNRAPPTSPLPPGIDRFHVRVANGETILRHQAVAALGDFTQRDWVEACGLGYRGWRKARPMADAQLARRIAAKLARHPGAMRRRSRLKAILREAKAEVIDALMLEPPAPGTHAARLQAIKTELAEAAAREAVTAAAEQKRFEEDGVDPADRQGHFERLFETEDPWKYGSAYEQEKYLRQIALLPEQKIGRALELGCAEGHFTVQLAPHVEHLLATDISTKALQRTQARCAAHKNIDYAVLDFSKDPIPGDMDLIICSETLYYLADEAELRQIAPRIAAALAPGGALVMAHAHAVQDDMSRTGFDWESVYGVDVINRVFSELPDLALERSLDTELYRIDRFRRIAADIARPIPVFETAPVVETLERDVARSVIWGGASILRSPAKALEQRRKIPILMYHGVSDTGPAALQRYRVSPGLFKAQIRWLRSNGYYAIGSRQLLEHMQNGQPVAGRPVVISFDDGFQDFADNAWPILAAHDFTAEMFIVTDRVGQTAIWDAHMGEPARLMDAATIAALAAEGALFGSHMATHTASDGLSAEGLVRELAGSRAKLAQWLGQPPISFAPPFSTQDSRLSWTALQCGYRIGFGGEGPAAGLDADPLNLPRVEVRGDRPLADFIDKMVAAL